LHISRIIGKMRLGIARTCWIGIKLLSLIERGVICCSIMIEFSCTLWREMHGAGTCLFGCVSEFNRYASVRVVESRRCVVLHLFGGRIMDGGQKYDTSLSV
jgi:hypothetical protein